MAINIFCRLIGEVIDKIEASSFITTGSQTNFEARAAIIQKNKHDDFSKKSFQVSFQIFSFSPTLKFQISFQEVKERIRAISTKINQNQKSFFR